MPVATRIPLRMIDGIEGGVEDELLRKHNDDIRVRPVVPDSTLDENWAHSKHSRDFIFKLLTSFYALLVVIVGIIMELSNLMNDGHAYTPHLKDLILASYLYGGSILFIAYAGLTVLVAHRDLHKQRKKNVRGLPEPEMLTNVSTGSMYLRIGCVVFGIIGVVYYGMVTLVCALGWENSAKECTIYSEIISVIAAIFIFSQMWFVFCNGKITFIGSPNIARLGLMHLVTTNLWMWLRYILYEEAETISELDESKFTITTTAAGLENYGHPRHVAFDPLTESLSSHSGERNCNGSHCVFGEFSEFMYTCVVEYSLICAGVAFVFWTSISSKREDVEKKLGKRNVITMDCSRTSEGLFGGFLVVISCIISILLFNAYSSKKELAQWIFLGTNAAYFILAILVSLLAFYRMRVLLFAKEKETEAEESAELLDQILLVVGLIGELVYCIGGIMAFTNNSQKENLSYLLFGVQLLRLVQVSLQSGLIMVSGRLELRMDDEEIVRYKPGKQIVTLMLMINCALFLMNIFEAQKAGITEEIVALYGNQAWALLVRGCSPLTIFYRFHSSACFAEIWKKTFKVRSQEGENGSRSSASS